MQQHTCSLQQHNTEEAFNSVFIFERRKCVFLFLKYNHILFRKIIQEGIIKYSKIEREFD